jgi:hypothetical protein
MLNVPCPCEKPQEGPIWSLNHPKMERNMWLYEIHHLKLEHYTVLSAFSALLRNVTDHWNICIPPYRPCSVVFMAASMKRQLHSKPDPRIQFSMVSGCRASVETLVVTILDVIKHMTHFSHGAARHCSPAAVSDSPPSGPWRILYSSKSLYLDHTSLSKLSNSSGHLPTHFHGMQ